MGNRNDKPQAGPAVPPPLNLDQLRWRCQGDELGFASTADVPPDGAVVGQDTALAALRFGLACRAKGQNIFVRGTPGTGRMTAVRYALQHTPLPAIPLHDIAYVHNFSQPDRPRLVRLPAGEAREFRRCLRRLCEGLDQELAQVLKSETVQQQVSQISDLLDNRLRELTAPLEGELAQQGMALVALSQGQAIQYAVVPRVDGKPVAPQNYQQLVAAGSITDAQQQAYAETFRAFQKPVAELAATISALKQEGADQLQALYEQALQQAFAGMSAPLRQSYPQPGVACFLQEVAADAIDRALNPPEQPVDTQHRYGVNIVLERDPEQAPPQVEEQAPTVSRLLGQVEPCWKGQNAVIDYSGIRCGSLLCADGGYLILDAQELLGEPGAWRALMRTLKSGALEMVPVEVSQQLPHQLPKPEPVPVDVRVILIGNVSLYYQLEQLDPDFADQFKVFCDFDTEMQRTPEALGQYARVVAGLARREGLPHFAAPAVAALCEHGARIAGQADKLTTRFGRVADIAREAAFLAQQAQQALVQREQVEATIERTRERARLPASKFQAMVESGTLIIETRGQQVGQINGLAVVQAGALTYGFPARITATISAGTAGLIDIEGRASMSGAIHTKGVNILGGLLRHLLRLEHPLACSASLAFEQSYGGIDGDSASGAEACCLLSALTEAPLRQDLAMTGAIDQLGHIQAIGGVNEKIEGFYDCCRLQGLTGSQGVLIPQSNARNLMLRRDLVAAVERGEFHIYAVATIQQALALFTGREIGVPGDCDKRGCYPSGTLLWQAQQRARMFWEQTLSSPLSGGH